MKDLKYTTMFAAVDADSDGAIDVDELITGLRKLGMLAKSKAEAQQLLDRFGNGASPSLRRSLLRKPLIYLSTHASAAAPQSRQPVEPRTPRQCSQARSPHSLPV